MEKYLKGKILQGVGGLYTVRILDTDSPLFGETVSCRARGSFRHNNLTPLSGDNVIVAPADEAADRKDKTQGEQFVIDEITEDVFPKTKYASYRNDQSLDPTYGPIYGVSKHYVWAQLGNGAVEKEADKPVIEYIKVIDYKG